MIVVEPQKQAARALIKFCEDHSYNVAALESIRACLRALNRNDVHGALGAYKKVPLGGMGCFNDWIPKAKFSNETAESVLDLFEVLVAYWSLSMRALLKETESN